MNKDMTLAQQIRGLKTTAGFVVRGEKARQRVCRIAKTLKDSEIIAFDVVTKDNGKNTFKVAAI